MKRKVILLLVMFCFTFTGCNKLVNSAMSLKEKDQQQEQTVVEKQQQEDLENQNNTDEPISKNMEQQEDSEEDVIPTQTPTPEPVKNNNQIVTDKDDFEVSVETFDIIKNTLENTNTFYEAIGFDSDNNIVIRYATAVVYSNMTDENLDNDSMRVTIEAFDVDDNLLWKEDQEFNNFEITELGDFSVLMIDKKGNLIIENISYKTGSTLRCLNYKTGNVNWANSGFSVSIACDNDGNYYYVTYYGSEIICLDSNGNEKWTVDYFKGSEYFWPSISIKDDKIIIDCSEPTNNGEKNVQLEYDKDGAFIQKLD